jgi:hypothetical protein
MLLIDFDWQRSSSIELVPPPAQTDLFASSGRGRTAPASDELRHLGEAETIRPLDRRPRLYLDFAALETPRDYLSFARSWGFLRSRPGRDTAEPVTMWRNEVTALRRALERRAAGDFGEPHAIANVSLELAADPDGGLAFRMHAKTLLAALWLQFGQRAAQGAELRTCDQCGRWFETGATGKRKLARFCADRCRDAYHNARRAK